MAVVSWASTLHQAWWSKLRSHQLTFSFRNRMCSLTYPAFCEDLAEASKLENNRCQTICKTSSATTKTRHITHPQAMQEKVKKSSRKSWVESREWRAVLRASWVLCCLLPFPRPLPQPLRPAGLCRCRKEAGMRHSWRCIVILFYRTVLCCPWMNFQNHSLSHPFQMLSSPISKYRSHTKFTVFRRLRFAHLRLGGLRGGCAGACLLLRSFGVEGTEREELRKVWI